MVKHTLRFYKCGCGTVTGTNTEDWPCCPDCGSGLDDEEWLGDMVVQLPEKKENLIGD